MSSGYTITINDNNIDFLNIFSHLDINVVNNNIISANKRYFDLLSKYSYTTKDIYYFQNNYFTTAASPLFKTTTGYNYNGKDLGELLYPVVKGHTVGKSINFSDNFQTGRSTYTYPEPIPTGAKYMHIISMGGGGGGGSGGANSSGGGNGGRGGGSSALSVDCFIPIGTNTFYSVQVGIGGTGGPVLGGNGNGNVGVNGKPSYVLMNTDSNSRGLGGSNIKEVRYGDANGGNGGTGGLGAGGTPGAIVPAVKNNYHSSIGGVDYNFSLGGNDGSENSGNSGGVSVTSLGFTNILPSYTNLYINNSSTTPISPNANTSNAGAGGYGGDGDTTAQNNYGSAGGPGKDGMVLIFFYFTNIPTNVIRYTP